MQRPAFRPAFLRFTGPPVVADAEQLVLAEVA